jgi:hypothetical protein
MEALVMAVKRDWRDAVPADWKRRLERIEGVKILSGGSPTLVRLEATAPALRKIRETFGAAFHIERPIEHERLG